MNLSSATDGLVIVPSLGTEGDSKILYRENRVNQNLMILVEPAIIALLSREGMKRGRPFLVNRL